MKSFLSSLSPCFSSPSSLSLITVSRHEGFCSNDRSFSPFCVCGFFSFSYTFFVVIDCSTLVRSPSLPSLAVELARMATENNNHPSNTIIRTRLLRVLSRLFLLSESSQKKSARKKKKTPMQQTTFPPTHNEEDRDERKLKKDEELRVDKRKD